NRAFSAILRADTGTEPTSGQLASSLGESVVLRIARNPEKNRGKQGALTDNSPVVLVKAWKSLKIPGFFPRLCQRTFVCLLSLSPSSFRLRFPSRFWSLRVTVHFQVPVGLAFSSARAGPPGTAKDRAIATAASRFIASPPHSRGRTGKLVSPPTSRPP